MLRYLAFTSVLLVILAISANAENRQDRFQVGHDIRIDEGEQANDVSCLNCSVYIRGQVAGDVFTLKGNVVLSEGAQVGGDIATLLGNVRLESGSQVGGDIATMGGALRRDSGAMVGGSVSSMGTGWIAGIFLLPLFFLGGVVALIIWLVQRNRRTTQGVRPLAA
jgi:hypothetical protein